MECNFDNDMNLPEPMGFYDDSHERFRKLNRTQLKKEYINFIKSEIEKELPPYLNKNLDAFANKAHFDCFLYVTLCHKKEECKGCAPFKIIREKIVVYNINHLRKIEYKFFEKELIKIAIEIISELLKKLELDSFIYNQRVNQYNQYNLKSEEKENIQGFYEKYVNQDGLNYCKSCNYNYPETQAILRISWAKSSQDFKEDSKNYMYLKNGVILLTVVFLNWYVYKYICKYMMGNKGIFKD
jgi:hypothetical protein